MLTRLKVSGFKNLVDVDVRFGAFNCIAGANGVGKSNLFDAIHFLSLLAEKPLAEAAAEVRGGASSGVGSLFHRTGDETADRMTLSAEMIVPRSGQDDLGQEAEATSTFLRYSLALTHRDAEASGAGGPLEILREELSYITQGDAFRHLLFEHSASKWRRSVVKSDRRGGPFISTEGEGPERTIRMHQDGGGSRGRPLGYLARRLPRTVLSRSNSAESPTALLARREMQSWRMLQLEPASLRESDPFEAPPRLGSDGSHLPATLHRLARERRSGNGAGEEGQLYAQLANRLAELFEDVRDLWVDRNEKRELLTVHVRTADETDHPAPALSDGSLRFLALAVLEQDSESQGLLCLEEPENGVHPERLPAMLRLLQDLSTQLDEEVGPDNPLRQVILNTHSPAVVQLVPEESLIVAVPIDVLPSVRRSRGVSFRALAGTWRQKDPEAPEPVAPGSLLSYLRPVNLEGLRLLEGTEEPRVPRVVERDDLQPLIPGL